MVLCVQAIYKSGGVDVNYKHYHDGAFVYFVPSTKHLRRVPATKWGVSVALLLSDTRILDVLLNNSDRHHGHFLFGEHWADGKMKPVLIDHAAGFRKVGDGTIGLCLPPLSSSFCPSGMQRKRATCFV